MGKQYKKSPVLMKTANGYEHMFESITEAAKFAQANAWTMSLKMQVKGYFEDRNGNKYYRQDKMNTTREYYTSSAKITKRTNGKKIRRKTPYKTAVIVDGVKYDSIQEAEEKCGFKRDTLGQALRHGQTKTKGHTIAYADEIPTEKPIEIQKIMECKPEKETKISIIVNSDDPAIEAINDKIVSILKKSGVYEEIKKLSQAIQKLSK